MEYYGWEEKLNELVKRWELGLNTIMITSNCQHVEITKNGTKLISKINGLKCDKVIFDEFSNYKNKDKE